MKTLTLACLLVSWCIAIVVSITDPVPWGAGDYVGALGVMLCVSWLGYRVMTQPFTLE